MGRGLILKQCRSIFLPIHLCARDIIQYYPVFPRTILVFKLDYPRVTHPSAALGWSEDQLAARLACLKRAASVRSEPGSNSPLLFLPIARQLITHLNGLFSPFKKLNTYLLSYF